MVTQRDLDRTIVCHDQRSSICRWPMRGRTAFVMPSAAKTRTTETFHQMLELYVIRFTHDGKYLSGYSPQTREVPAIARPRTAPT